MDIEQLRNFCLKKKHCTEDFPFDTETLVFKVLNKMFVIAPLEKWERGEASINVKCDPVYSLELREEYESIYAGPYVSNLHWNTISINTGELRQDFIFQLIDHSYDMVVKSMPKKLQEKF